MVTRPAKRGGDTYELMGGCEQGGRNKEKQDHGGCGCTSSQQQKARLRTAQAHAMLQAR